MPALTPDVCDFNRPAPDFTLPATDGRTCTLNDVTGENGLLIMFICNHCPYVLAVIDKIVRDATDLKALGVGVAAICSNDPVAYPADNFDNMRKMAEERAFPFPYLHDADQSVARAYGAVCTPDFFGFNRDLGLQYRGRLDATRVNRQAPDLRRDLFEAMKQVAETGEGPAEQIPSMGCSIKWKSV
ncbi:thioredoxin family protein [Labrenzia sp. 011]|uniref:thioredoxin family protein n=1 Tax=Labrenzia sp. 011 TaxID=2171494 RepID=UPI000D51E486|nr:thioredoxin family protein [Labrenzia sp. 011]PVB61020.1 thioredoxin family protein [Labrenzia sp. 011]